MMPSSDPRPPRGRSTIAASPSPGPGPGDLTDPRLRAAREALGHRPGGTDRSRDEAFRTLLGSGDIAAVCVALDSFREHHAFMRHGADNPYEAHTDAVAEAGRAIVRARVRPDEVSASPGDGQLKIALDALMRTGEPEDADLVAELLGCRGLDRGLQEAACAAAMGALDGTGTAHPALFAALTAIVFDRELTGNERAVALMAIHFFDAPEALPIVLSATEEEDLHLQVRAALHLSDHLPEHREHLERLVSAWPAECPGPADLVIGELKRHASKA